MEAEQEKFVRRWSFGALLQPVYFFGSRMTREGFLSFVPFYNIYQGIKGIFRGRTMVWESGKWKDFELYKKRQKLLDRLAIVFYVGLIALMAVGGYAVYRATSPVGETASTFLQNIVDKKFEQAYAMGSASFQEQGDVEHFQQFIEESPELNEMKTFTIGKTEVQSDPRLTSGTVYATGVDEKNTETPIKIILIKENGTSWKIDDFVTNYEEQDAQG